jgi:hypothetical protein
MIIFAGQPNRFIPFLMDDIHERITLKPIAFSNILTSADKEKILPLYLTGYGFYDLLLAKDNSITTNSQGKIDFNKFFKNGEFISGIFNPNIVLKQKTDTLLSIITNPVTRVYEMYYFAKIAREGKTHRPIIIDKSIYKHFMGCDISEMTIEQFIDFFIECKGLFIRDDIAVCDNLFRQYKITEDLDLICTTELHSLIRGINFINNLFKISLTLDTCHYMLPRPNICNYRLKEIEHILANDIEIYNKINNIK